MFALDFLLFVDSLLLAPFAKLLELDFALHFLLVLGREVVVVLARLAD